MMEAEEQVKELWAELSPEAREFVSRVIEAEKDKLHMSLPRGINDEILSELEDVVK